MNRVRRLKKDGVKDERALGVAKEADRLQDLKALNDTPGGKQLVDLLMEDAVGQIHQLRGGYKSLSHIEMIALIASIDSKLDTAKLLLNAKDSMDIQLELLEEALRE